MRNYLLGSIAIASAFTFMVQSAPVSAQGGTGSAIPVAAIAPLAPPRRNIDISIRAIPTVIGEEGMGLAAAPQS